MDTITLKENRLADAIKIHKTTKEFKLPFNEKVFHERIGSDKSLVLTAYLNNHPTGFMVAHDYLKDGSIYCWLAAVDPKYRQQGILKALMDYFESWCRKNGYHAITIKTRNCRRSMLAYLVKYDYNFTGIKKAARLSEHEIFLKKDL